jgi:glycosyltransferase involved in cell wall biosynthesis
MPVLNGERFIDEALASIVRQQYANLELVVVDDGSTDTTAAHVDRFRPQLDIRYVRHESCRGVARSVNDGIRAATGDLISFLDHDDAWLPRFLETQVAHLEAHPDVGMVHCDFQTMDVNGEIIEASVAAARARRRPSGYVFPLLFQDSFIVGNSVLIRRECFERLGGFDENVRWGDYHLWLKIARHYKIDYVDAVLTQYRQHGTQSTRGAASEDPNAIPVGVDVITSILELYPAARRELGQRAIDRRMAVFYFDRGYRLFNLGNTPVARTPLARALRLWPTNPRYLSLYAATYLGASGGRVARDMWRRVRGTRAAAGGGIRGVTQ